MNNTGTTESLRAVIYVIGNASQARQERVCGAWCATQGYEVVGLVVDDCSAGRWRDTLGMLVSGEADIVVVADREYLPPTRLPRVEVVREADPGIPRQRRPQTIRPSRQ